MRVSTYISYMTLTQQTGFFFPLAWLRIYAHKRGFIEELTDCALGDKDQPFTLRCQVRNLGEVNSNDLCHHHPACHGLSL